MKPINIYGLTRVYGAERWERLERQMSGRRKPIRIKSWEMESMAALCTHLTEYIHDISNFEFYYSFTLPKLGKEFDLLRISSRSVLNIELKSREVSDEDIRKQLQLNNYYLSMLNRTGYFFTYISSSDRLVRMSHSGRLLEAQWSELVEAITEQTDCFAGDIEELFRENEYLISPLTDTGRFLRKEYFLTFQQRDIKKNILRDIRNRARNAAKKNPMLACFTGLPGTGKTLLLYDLALELSSSEKVGIFHFGAHEAELEKLDERLKRVDFIHCKKADLSSVSREYAALFIDEGHRLDPETLKFILSYAKERFVPVIISYDSEAPIAKSEQKQFSSDLIEKIPGIIKYRLTNRIRLNKELSDFIAGVVNLNGHHRRGCYPSVSLLFAKDMAEAQKLMQDLMNKGYTYIRDGLVDAGAAGDGEMIADVREATSREYDRVLMVLDGSFFYDEDGYLRSELSGDGRVRHFYHGLNRAKKKIAVVVIQNTGIFDRILGILQK
ncbi:MAG: ATP-binding protein [Lachnospiraceae bacterium]|nr:ATP-binding protein [Lachnospiraceae bacterium]